jgi:hypothetical protein
MQRADRCCLENEFGLLLCHLMRFRKGGREMFQRYGSLCGPGFAIENSSFNEPSSPIPGDTRTTHK